ncbi:MAG TPA: DUF1553 domain-containing protein, partial [Planctomycetaceae bacterium]|nr:DUF1553 domain-containing protein [Planctomycetaceae bacterium]
THIHRRGEFLQAAERVEPGVLSFLHSFPDGAPRDRLSFARWLVDPANPLVGRVTVNRHWAVLFGRGLVRTVEDFGFQGELPSHPELLDWLAVEFVGTDKGQGSRDKGQTGMSDSGPRPLTLDPRPSVKRLHRLLVTSATYRQSSRVAPELLRRDPENVLLARGPRVRLEAELVRDAALHAAGLLSQKIGGPSVFPPQPASVTTEGTYGRLDWKASEGDDRYRRSLYTFSKRTAPFAMYATFDAPSGEACVARREVSNTPLQALTLLNDTVFVEAAQELGRWAAELPVHGDGVAAVEERMIALVRRCLTRPPDTEELRLLLDFHDEQKCRLATGELNAGMIGGGHPDGAIEVAAWTSVARAVMNLDEFIGTR